MNEYYLELIQRSGLPASLAACAAGRIPVPMETIQAPADWYGFPPALWPIWCDPSLVTYEGYWKHWFTPRAGTFVRLSARAGRKAREEARTVDQFFCSAVMSSIVANEGVTPDVESFANAVDVRNVPECDEVSLRTGDNPTGYLQLPQFKDDPPLEWVADPSAYRGDFPDLRSGSFGDPRLACACAYETDDEILAQWPDHIPKPLALFAERPSQSFDEVFERGDFATAWLLLNAPGWSVPQARQALKRLSTVANDPLFDLLVEAWTAASEDDAGY